MSKLFGTSNIVLGLYILGWAIFWYLLAAGMGGYQLTTALDYFQFFPGVILSVILITSGIAILKERRIGWILSIRTLLLYTLVNFIVNLKGGQLGGDMSDMIYTFSYSFIPITGGWGQSLFYGIIQLLAYSKPDINRSLIKFLLILFVILSFVSFKIQDG